MCAHVINKTVTNHSLWYGSINTYEEVIVLMKIRSVQFFVTLSPACKVCGDKPSCLRKTIDFANYKFRSVSFTS